jgi:ADP-ribose pyrophosphatase YjhB (NUDIX family)
VAGPLLPEIAIARAAAVMLPDGHILLSRNLEDAFWSLPGGRVEPGERPEAALRREIAEELGVEGANIGALLWVIENPFTHAGRRYRETGFYYQVAPPAGACPIVTGEFTGPEPHLRLRWFPLAKLAAVDLRPSVLRERLMALPHPARSPG